MLFPTLLIIQCFYNEGSRHAVLNRSSQFSKLLRSVGLCFFYKMAARCRCIVFW